VILPLNPDQEVAANSINGNIVVVAGPGSGKTAVSIQRFMRMRATHNIPVRDILNLTFTRSAATEMVERMGMDDAKSVFRTFDSYALEILQKERANLPFA
jgi:superfamily I DNA/RNA helicase